MLTTIRQGEGYYIKGSFGERLNPKEKYHELQKNVCKALGISLEQLKERNRKREIVIARHICFYIARENNLGSLKFLAINLNGCDHSTVIHGIGLVQDLLDAKDMHFLNYYNLCKHLLKRP